MLGAAEARLHPPASEAKLTGTVLDPDTRLAGRENWSETLSPWYACTCQCAAEPLVGATVAVAPAHTSPKSRSRRHSTPKACADRVVGARSRPRHSAALSTSVLDRE